MFTMAAPSRVMASTVGLLPVSCEEKAQVCHYLILMVNNPGFHSQKTFSFPHLLFETQRACEKIKNSHS